jgi:hypothetical protein
VGLATPTVCLITSAAFGSTFHRFRIHGAAQIRRVLSGFKMTHPQRAEIFAPPLTLASFFCDRYELVAFRNATSTYIRMNRFCFRITFQSEDAAFYQFHVFPPVVHIPWVSGWARKRNASTQLILVELKEEDDRDRFLELCCENPHVLKIEEISEDEFTATPSQAI